jgi:ABC-type spermidine/putrescine transport system permease subunit II
LAFTFSLDDVVTSYFLQGTSQSPLPIVLLGMIRFRITPEINAVGVFVMILTVALTSLAVVVFSTAGRLGRSSRRSRLVSLYDR